MNPPSRTVRIVRVLFLAALLLVPLAERGHTHSGRDLARPCAVCVAAHHSPAATALPLVAFSGPLCRTAMAVLAPAESPLRRTRSPETGRAPPRSLPIAGV